MSHEHQNTPRLTRLIGTYDGEILTSILIQTEAAEVGPFFGPSMIPKTVAWMQKIRRDRHEMVFMLQSLSDLIDGSPDLEKDISRRGNQSKSRNGSSPSRLSKRGFYTE